MSRTVPALLLTVVLLFGASVGRAQQPQQVRVTTSAGGFVIELDAQRAPLTVANFLRYVDEGFYSGTLFHRVIANFVIQGGGLNPDYTARKAHEPIPNEAGNGLLNVRGSVGLARTAGPHTGDAQFYINVADNADLNPLPSRWGYAIFGRVVEGMDVVDAISLSATGAQGPLRGDAPLKPVVIEKVERVNR